MVSNAALCVIAASCLNARVTALVAHARLATRTLGVEHALWPTPGVRVSEVVGQTSARPDTAVFLLTLRVGAAW